MKKILPAVVSLLLAFPSYAFPQDKPVQLRAAIHLSSVVSEGNYELPKIAATARANKISVVVVTDRDLMKWEYGLWPFSNIFKKTVERHSVFTYPIERYLSYIEEIQKKVPDLVLVPGIESAPFYYWEGSPLDSVALDEEKAKGLKGLHKKPAASGNLKMYNWHRHILALGMEKYADYRNLPVIGNPRGLIKEFNAAALWPLVLLAFGIWLWFLKNKIYNRQKIIAAVVTAIGLIFLCNNWPFAKFKFDQYHDSGVRPYQNYINYVNAKGGLTFWAHPEAKNNQNLAGIYFVTPEYSSILSQTECYTGFCVFPEGYKQIGKPRGLWDVLLLEYCLGVRKKPIFAIAGLAFEKGNLSQAMKTRQTVIIASEKTRKAVLDALRNGKMYALEGNRSADFSLNEFYVSNEADTMKAASGDTVKLTGNPYLHISGSLANRQEPLEIRVIRNGSIFKRYFLESPFDVICVDEQAAELGTKSYYRIEISGRGLRLVSNPIFVERM